MDILEQSALAYKKLTNKEYIIVVGKSNKMHSYIVQFTADEFKHIFGLHKLKDNNDIHRSSSNALLHKIIRKEITANDIVKSEKFSIIENRIKNAIYLEEYFDKFTEIFNWDKAKSKFSVIDADLMIPTKSAVSDNCESYIFLKNSDRKNTLELSDYVVEQPEFNRVETSIIDKKNYRAGQVRPPTLLYKEKIDLLTNERQVLYIHPSYKKELEQHTVQSQPQQNGNIKQVKFDSPAPKNIIHSGSGAAAAVMPKPNPFKNFINNLKNLFKKQDKQPAIPAQTKAQSEIIEKEIKAEENPVPPKLAKLIEARAAFSENNITLAEYQQAIANYIHSFNGKEMWIKAIDTLRKQLDECPDNHKKAINYEIDTIERNFERKFAPKHPERKQTLDEIKRAAHENYVKMQNEKAKSEKEEITVNNNHER